MKKTALYTLFCCVIIGCTAYSPQAAEDKMALPFFVPLLTNPSQQTPAPPPIPPDNPNPDDGEPTIQWDPSDFLQVYDVGPGQPYAEPSEVPWEDLTSSTLVRIHYRDTPYRSKFVISTTGTPANPMVVMGISDNGRLPVISGDNAVTRTSMYYLNEKRSVVKVGNYTGPDDTDQPAYVYIQGLDIRSGRPSYTFTDRHGATQQYLNNAAAIHIEEGDHVSVIGCELHDSGNGLFSTHLANDILVRSNHIYDNGIEGRYYEHNSYTGSKGIIFEYNHYGPLRTGCDGNNLKDRSSGTVIRYNWIESGNRQLDLVETDYFEVFNDPAYNATFVYGNVLVEPDGAGNSQILHYGGDGGDTAMYRQGTLYFYHNTVVSTRSGNTTLMRLSTNQVQARLNNNLLFSTAGGSYLAITSGNGQTILKDNWISSGWRNTHESGLDPGATVTDLGNVAGTDPQFENINTQDFHLRAASPASGAGGSLPAATSQYPVKFQYVKHQGGEERPTGNTSDIGAFQREEQ